MWGRRGKYGAKKTSHAGLSFASKLEAAVYDVIKLRELAGELRLIRCQAQVHLTDARIIYKPDFECEDLRNGGTLWIEAKGFSTPEWKLKLRLWRYYGPGPLEIWMGSHARPKLIETVIPKS